ncbi:unnamed protein product [Symbiodinium sp. KB8]|nr:unnamed protein product [Symbiodinium sp. KB8]
MLRLRGPEVQHCTRDEVFVACNASDPFDLLCLERLRFLGRLLRSGPDAAWALLQNSPEALTALQSACDWCQQALEHTCDVGCFREEWPAWQKLITSRPRLWKGLLKRAAAWHKGRRALSVCWSAFVRSTWATRPAPAADPGLFQHACLICRRAFPTSQSWASHAALKHGFRTRHFSLAEGKRCRACGATFSCTRRLRNHLGTSRICLQAIEDDLSCLLPMLSGPDSHVQCRAQPGHGTGHLPDVRPEIVSPLLTQLSELVAGDDEAIFAIISQHVAPFSALRDTLQHWVSSLSHGALRDAAEDVLLCFQVELLCDTAIEAGTSRHAVLDPLVMPLVWAPRPAGLPGLVCGAAAPEAASALGISPGGGWRVYPFWLLPPKGCSFAGALVVLPSPPLAFSPFWSAPSCTLRTLRRHVRWLDLCLSWTAAVVSLAASGRRCHLVFGCSRTSAVELHVLTHMDVMTQGLFLATTLHRFHCPGFGKTRDAWHQVWGNSILSWMAWGSSLETLVIVSWGVFVLQLVLFALHAMPVQPVSFACQSEKQGYLNVAGFGYVRIWHADALKDLASSNRMAMVSAGHLRLSVKRAHQELQAQPPNDTRFLHILKMELRHLLLRIVLVNLCTNCTKIEVQTTIFALGRFDSDGTLDQEGFLCITLAHLTSLQALQVIVAGLLAIRSAQEELEGVRETMRASRESKEESSEIFRVRYMEVKWYLAGTKSSERSYAAARLIRQLLESDYPALRSLMYRLDPMEFTSEDATSKLIKFLESSPMNKQPIPDAGAKLSAYYRKLARRSGETIPQFLIREETLHDEMWRSLQRLLREKELDFERYDVTVPELKEFCGIGADASVYYGGLTEEESTRTQTPPAGSRQASEQDDEELRSADASLPSAPGAPPTRGKPLDLIQRLMDKGLVPLAALDIIRGWMVLEMASENDTEKTLVKASAQNKLGYDSVRQALLTLHEDRGKGYGSPHRGQRFGAGKASGKYGVMYSVDEESADWHDDTYGEWGSDPWEAEWAYWMPTEEYHSGQDNYWAEPDAPGDDQTTENAEGSQDPQVEEAMQAMAKLREEEKELQAYMADAQRNLDQARKAVAAAKRDRGWTSTLPTSSKGPPRPTSTWMHQGKGKSSNLGAMYFNKGGKSGYYPDYAKGKKGSGKTKGKFNQWMVEPAYEVMTMDVLEADGCPVQSGTPAELLQAAADATIHPTETVMDTGATVSAGGQDAVNALLTSLAQARPDMNVTIVQQDRPYFRFGSGAWGQALYKVCIAVPGHSFKLQFYALPSPGVPVLLGMRELQQLGVIINLQNSKALVLGKPWSLRVNSKQQILFDMTAIFAKIPTQPRSNISYRTPSANACMMTAIEPNVVPHQSGSACDDRDGYTLCPLQIGESQQLHQANRAATHPAFRLQTSSAMAAPSSTASVDEATKQAIRDTVREAIREELDSALSSTKGRRKEKKTALGELDYTRTMKEEQADPRMSATQWPCFGTHTAVGGGNRYASWTQCTRCDVRLSYVPRVQAPANSRRSELPAHVTAALERLRTKGVKPSTMEGKFVRSQIKIIEQEHVLTGAKPTGASPKAKGYPKVPDEQDKETDKKKAAAQEIEESEESEELTKDTEMVSTPARVRAQRKLESASRQPEAKD